MQDSLHAAAQARPDPGTEHVKAPDAASGPLRVELVTDCANTAERLRRILNGAAGIELASRAASDQAADVLLVEFASSSPQERLRLQRSVSRHGSTRVLWLVSAMPAASEAIQSIVNAVSLGWCHGYVTHDCPASTMIRAIRAVAHQELWLPRRMMARALAASQSLRSALGPSSAPGDSRARRSPLTARERQILQLVRAGLTNKEAGRHLGIEEDTVKKHLRNMFTKLGVRRRVQMLATTLREARAAG